DNIRELKERATVAPVEGKYKIYIIDEVHMLSKSAFNALLKTLEEPPAHVIFIMATTDLYKVLPTIISRSQVYEFKLATPDIMQKHLQKIVNKEGIKITDEALELIVRRGGGSYRDSISLLDQISTLKDGEISADDIVSSLGLPKQAKMDNLLEAYLSGDLAEITACLKDLLNSGVRAEIVAEELIEHIVDNPRAELLPLLKSLSEVNAPFPEAKLLLAFTSGLLCSDSSTSQMLNLHSEQAPMSNLPPEQDPLSAFLEAVAVANPSISEILSNNSAQRLNGNTICIIPAKNIYKNVLNSKNNLELFEKCLPKNYNLKILNPEDAVISTNDPQINKISGIMGGKVMEVKESDGGIPF
ncbi:AAA family ATPase, partial [Candidatus Saccharibacteria bacterium]|nr:AAA family ATPase [Candidatus Saccharibacteria bacterium]